MDELFKKFLPQFTELARDRLKRAYAAAASPDEPTLIAVIRDLHGIAGEAGLLGLGPIVKIARSAEEHAKRLRDGRSEAEAAAFVDALRALGAELEKVGATDMPTEHT
ncbi:MAG TPA: Hpt domain-containing protein [Kofleriaceae bacterium]|nr:Hpt domain-containing protein [Kofleriaceae bacterium]